MLSTTITSTLVQFIVLIALCCSLSFYIMHALALVSRKYLLLRLILLPGVVVHELAHVAACVLTHTHIEKISFWDEAGGSVVHHVPKLQVVTQPFISLAPLPVGLAMLFFLSPLVTPFDWPTIPLLMVMVSVGATLAPSKTDFIHAIEGLLFLFGVTLAIIYGIPQSKASIQDVLQPLNQHLLLIVAILATMWILFFFSHQILYRRR